MYDLRVSLLEVCEDLRRQRCLALRTYDELKVGDNDNLVTFAVHRESLWAFVKGLNRAINALETILCRLYG